MYPTSAAYKTAITKNVRDVKITGTITLKDATTINISDADIMQGSLYFTEQCVSGEDIEVGNVYVSEMGLTLTSPPANPYSLDGARVALEFGIDVSEDGSGLWEYVPLGYYYVSDIQRKHTAVNLKALDGMVLFDVDISAGVSTTETLRGFVVYCCMMTGVTLATSIAELDTFANATTEFTLPAESKVKTYRDLLMWACQIMGAFARMNREGQLEIIPVTSRGSVKTINKAERFTSDVSDFVIKITKVAMRIGEQEYYRGVDGMAMMLEENPLMAGMGEAQINAVLNNILAQVTLAEYVPFNVDFAGDPALQPGDYVTLKDTGVLGGGDVLSFVTHSSWKYRGGHNIVGAGRSGYLRGVQLQQEKAVSSILSIARAAQDVALAANQSTQLIKDAIGGHVLIRQSPDETNEILIMDHPDPTQATKIWRWNMGGLGYSDNVTGADNPDREYDIAMTMDGAINANFIKTGQLDAGVVRIGPTTTFAPGYDPVDNHVYFQYSINGTSNWHDTFNPASDKYMRQKVGDDGTWSDAMRVVGEDGPTGPAGQPGQDGVSSYLWVRYSQNSDGDPMTTDPTGAKYIGVATTTTASAPTDYTDYSWSLIKGSDGIPGEPGADGQTSYLHIKYSDDGETFTPTWDWETEIENVAYKYIQYINANNWAAQGFKPTENLVGATTIKASLKSNGYDGVPPDTYWHVYTDNNGIPGVSISQNGFGTVLGVDWAGNFLWSTAEIKLSEPLQEGQQYWLVVMSENGDSSNRVKALYSGSDVYTDGYRCTSSTKGASWAKFLDRDLTFIIRGYNIVSYDGENPGTYIGTYVDFNPVDSTDFNAYTWNKVRGEDGKDGYTPIKGTDYFDGVDGLDGTSSYLWVRYSQNANGNPMVTDPTGAKYIGIATTTTASAPTDYTDYSWSLIKGTDGIPGEPGADGRTSYLHIKYSDDGETFTANGGETVGAWIGAYVDFNPVDSTDFNAYTWNKVKGEDGQDVRKFTSQPVPPYDVGDLWIGGSDGKNTLICVTARESGDFVASDWKPMTAPDVLKVDNRCKALFHFDGSINDHRGIMPTFTRDSKAYLSDGTEVDAGVARFEAGQFGQAVLVEEGTTNLLANPSFETGDFSGWDNTPSFGGTGWSIATDDVWIGNRAAKLPGTGNHVWQGKSQTILNPTVGATYTLSGWIKCSSGVTYGVVLRIRKSTDGGSTWTVLGGVTSTGISWTNKDISYTVEAGVNAILFEFFSSLGNASGKAVWVDGVQVEKKPYATSFTSGTRSPETLTIPTAGVLNPQEGAVACWVYVNDASKYQNRYSTIFMADAGGNGKGIWLYHSNNSAYWRYQIRDENNNSKVITVADSEIPNGWHFFAIKWKSTEAKLFVDGVLKGTMENPYLPSAIQMIYIGCWGAGNQLNSLIDDLAIFNYAPTDEEIQAWYEAGAPFYALDLPKPELPGYVKIESDGLRVYDNTGKLRGIFGSWLKELIRKYGIKIIDGEIYSTMFQTGEEGASDYIRLSSDASQPLLVVNDDKDALSIWAGNGGGFIQFFDSSADSMRGQILPHNDADGVGLRVSARSQSSLNYALSLYGMAGIEMHGNVWVNDDFRVFGNKNAVVPTENYGLRDLSVLEMPEVKFMDEGVGELTNGLCRIDIDPIFLETIEPNTTETPFIVHLTPYDWLMLRVKEIGDTYFIIEERDGLDGKFSWQLSATRKGYAGERMRRVDDDEGLLTSNWEDELDGFLEQES